MSRQNIVSIVPLPPYSIVVTFAMKSGELRAYKYSGPDAIAVLTGSDPRDLRGDEVLPTHFSAMDIAKASIEILAELF